MELLQAIAITLATLGLLVTIHEYGHFWVARRCGIKVLRFSIGFGTALFRWHDKQGTEFVIAAIPLGGYVKMLDEREGNVAPELLSQAFNRQPVSSRLATVAAGPLANFALAIVVYWLLFAGGVSGVVPIVAAVAPGSIADLADLEAGQEILAVDGEATPTWQALHLRLMERIGESGAIEFTVKYPDSDVEYQSTSQLDRWLSEDEAGDLMAGIGIELYRPLLLPVVAQVVAGSPAAQAGLLERDLIVSADGEAMADWPAWVNYVRDRPGQSMEVSYRRGGGEYRTTLTPDTQFDKDNKPFGRVGLGVKIPEWPEEMKRSFSYGFVGAGLEAVKKTWSMSVFTLESIKKMLLGLISPKNLSGPITIAKVASASASAGLESYLGFLALLSISLGVLNLLPIPVLDGGHIMFNLVELITGSAVPEKIQLIGYQLGVFMIVGVMGLALFNDFARL